MPHQLILCGAGLRGGELTVAARKALKSCARIHLLCMPSELAAAIRAEFPRAEDLGSLQHAAGDRSDALVLKRLSASLRRRGCVGVVVAGHPLLYSPGQRLVERCRKEKISYRVLPGVSSYDGVLAAVAPYLPAREREVFGAGMLVLSSDDWSRGRVPLDRRLSVLVLNLSRPRFARALRALERAYGRRRLAYLVRVGERELVEPLRLGELAGRRLDGQTLFVPGGAR